MKLLMPELPATGKWIPNVPYLDFYPESGYFFHEKPISYRISEVITTEKEREWFAKARNGEYGEDKQIELLLAIERGGKVHEWHNSHARGRSYNATPYQKICDQIKGLDLWHDWDVAASEYAMIDVKRSIAGTCDMILRHKKDKTRFAIADIKTKNNAYGKSGNPIIPGQKNYSAQLGGYINLFNLTWPLLKLEDCFVIYANELTAHIHKNRWGENKYNYIDCVDTYEGCRNYFFREMETI